MEEWLGLTFLNPLVDPLSGYEPRCGAVVPISPAVPWVRTRLCNQQRVSGKERYLKRQATRRKSRRLLHVAGLDLGQH